MADAFCDVLYIEDTPEDARMLAEAIAATEVPIRLITAADTPKAIRILSSPQAVDVIVLDWNLPGMTGPEIAQEIRKHRPSTPVFVFTGAPVSIAISEVREASLETVIAKPISLDAWEDLARLLSSFCEDVHSLQPNPAAG
jgi:CheY-like chemotaxis protein